MDVKSTNYKMETFLNSITSRTSAYYKTPQSEKTRQGVGEKISNLYTHQRTSFQNIKKIIKRRLLTPKSHNPILPKIGKTFEEELYKRRNSNGL